MPERAGVEAIRLLPDGSLLRPAPAGAADHADPPARSRRTRATRSRRRPASSTSAEQPRLDLVPPRERLRPAQSQRSAADVLPAPHRRASRASSWTRAATSSSSTTSSPSRSRRSTATARAASTTSRPAPTSRSRSCSTRRSPRWASSSTSDVEVRPRNPDDAPSILLDPSKTERDFDWSTRTPLRSGVARAVEYYRDTGVAETFTHLKHLEPTAEPVRE